MTTTIFYIIFVWSEESARVCDLSGILAQTFVSPCPNQTISDTRRHVSLDMSDKRRYFVS